MTGQNVGYIRVSSIDQNTDRQLEGVELDEVFTDKASGKDKNRPALQACLKHLRKGDTLHVHSIDRLARNMSDLLSIVEDQTAKGVRVLFNKENLTFSDDESPMDKLMLQMLGAFAEFERSMIRSRQREGIAAAQKRGVRIGAKPKLTSEQVAAIKLRASRGEHKAALAKEFGISRQTLYTALKNI